jgi:hypothetical protein
LQWFRQRWQVEVTFEEARSHLGVETQGQWSDLAILRTTPNTVRLRFVIANVLDKTTRIVAFQHLTSLSF